MNSRHTATWRLHLQEQHKITIVTKEIILLKQLRGALFHSLQYVRSGSGPWQQMKSKTLLTTHMYDRMHINLRIFTSQYSRLFFLLYKNWVYEACSEDDKLKQNYITSRSYYILFSSLKNEQIILQILSVCSLSLCVEFNC
jgi:hypothetical protein